MRNQKLVLQTHGRGMAPEVSFSFKFTFKYMENFVTKDVCFTYILKMAVETLNVNIHCGR